MPGEFSLILVLAHAHAPQSSPVAILAVIGGGNMGRAILTGAARAGVLKPAAAVVAEPDPAKREALERDGFTCVPQARDAVARMEPDGQVLLAIKPQLLESVSEQIRAGLAGRVVISILAGVPSAAVGRALSTGDLRPVRVVRAMPNLPAAIGQGTTGVCLGQGASAGDDAFALRLFAAVGPAVITLREDLMDAFTAVAGSGPAYLFLLAEAMLAGARGVGLDEAPARAAVAQALVGAAAMLAGDERTPGALRAAVTSPGGTTQAAMDVLLSAGVVETWVKAIEAARDRGRELGRAAQGG
jgi:pyrroline-5-carboxylate reductase